MNKELKERVGFDFIRYANCWEDADLLTEALEVKTGDRVLSIASAGDNSFALLAQDPALVVAADVNPVQLYLCELKKAAFTLPDHTRFLRFLGFENADDRLENYALLREKISAEARNWFDKRPEIIEAGIITQGKFEKYFACFRERLLPLIHSRKTVNALFAEKSDEAQNKFYDETWNNWRWRLFFRIFFSRYVMGKFGRDPEFMNEVRVTVSRYIFGKAENHLKQEQAQRNLYLQYILTGNFGSRLPFYARRENFEKIRERLDRIVFFEGYAEEAIREHGPFSVFNLSNIFEYLPSETCAGIGRKLAEGASQNSRFAYWNLMVPRKLSGMLPGLFQFNKERSQSLGAKDQGFFYHQFITETKR